MLCRVGRATTQASLPLLKPPAATGMKKVSPRCSLGPGVSRPGFQTWSSAKPGMLCLILHTYLPTGACPSKPGGFPAVLGLYPGPSDFIRTDVSPQGAVSPQADRPLLLTARGSGHKCPLMYIQQFARVSARLHAWLARALPPAPFLPLQDRGWSWCWSGGAGIEVLHAG